MSSIPKNIIVQIVNLLNERGFVLDADVDSFCRYVLFDGIVASNIEELRANGYRGGELKCWTTSFQGPSPAYGVYDSKRNWTNEDLIEYCHLRDWELNNEELTIEKLKFFNLGIRFYCHKCSHNSVLSPEILNKFKPDEYPEIRGKCSKCPEKNIPPAGLYPYF